jgi:hypothetical protein
MKVNKMIYVIVFVSIITNTDIRAHGAACNSAPPV